MSNITEQSIKEGTVKAVVNYLKDRKFKLERVDYIESISDIDKAYIIANRYIRNYIQNREDVDINAFKNEILKLSDKWKSNGNKWSSEDSEIANSKKNKRKKIVLEPLNEEIINEKLGELIKETNDEFIKSIETADCCIGNDSETKVLVLEEKKDTIQCEIPIIKLALEMGVNKFSHEFLENIDIERVLVGYKDDIPLYYFKSINRLFEVV